MKKFIIISLFPIFVFLLPFGLIGGSFFLTGCSEDSPSNYDVDYIQPDGETLFSESRYPYINEFFGTPSTNDFLNTVRWWTDYKTALKYQGFLKQTEEECSLTGLLAWARDGFVDAKEEVEAAMAIGEEHPFQRRQDAYITAQEIATYTGFSEVLNEVWAQLGVDWLNLHLVPILEYWFMMDEDMYRNDFLEGIQDKADGLGKISEEDYDTLIDILGRMLDDDDETYGAIWDAMPSAWDIIDFLREVDNVDVGDLTADIDSIIDSIRDAVADDTEAEVDVDDILTEVGNAVKRVWDSENNEGELDINYELDPDTDTVVYVGNTRQLLTTPVTLNFQDEFEKLLYSVRLLMNKETPFDSFDLANNWFDRGAMTDFDRVLLSLEDFLDPSSTVLPRDDFEAFLDNILDKSAVMDGSNSLSGILRGLAKTEPGYLQGLDYSIEEMFKKDRYGIQRSDSAASPMSAFRVLFAMGEFVDKYPLFSDFISATILGSSGDNNDCNEDLDCDINIFNTTPMPTACTTNSYARIFEFALSEISDTMDCYPDDPLEGWQWILHDERWWVIMGWPLWFGGNSGYPGLLGMFESFTTDPMFAGPAGLGPYFPSVNVVTGGAGNIAGRNHQLLAPVAPLARHFNRWDNGSKVKGTVDFLLALNEITVPAGRRTTGLQTDYVPRLPSFDWDYHFNSKGCWGDTGSLLCFVKSAEAQVYGCVGGAWGPTTGVMRAVEGVDGYGLATYALRRHTTDPADPVDHGLLDPVLNMLVMIVKELIDTDYDYVPSGYANCSDQCESADYGLNSYCDSEGGTCTLFSALMDYLGHNPIPVGSVGLDSPYLPEEIDVDNWVDLMDDGSGRYEVLADLFDPDSDGDVPLDIVRDLLIEYHSDIDSGARKFAPVLQSLYEDNDGAGADQVEDDIEFITDMLERITDEDTDLASIEGFEDIILYLLEENEDGSDNPFIANIKALLIKLLDLKLDIDDDGIDDDIERIHGLEILAGESPADYEARKKEYEDLYICKVSGDAWWLEGTEVDISRPYEGSKGDDATLGDLVSHLFGEDENLKGGLYSASNVKDFVDEMFDNSFMTSFWFEWLIKEPLDRAIVQHERDHSYNYTGVELASILGLVFFNNPTEDISSNGHLPYAYLREVLFRELDVDGNGIVDQKGLFALFKIMRWETDFTGLIKDQILYMGGDDMRPGGEAWEVWAGLLRYYANGESIF